MGAEGLAWTLMFALLPLTCVYYPVSVLPGWLQVVAWMLPPTYVFEGMRALLIDKVFGGFDDPGLRDQRGPVCDLDCCIFVAAEKRPEAWIAGPERRIAPKAGDAR
jgi:hypothetical protein